jgi:hypothetical protein
MDGVEIRHPPVAGETNGMQAPVGPLTGRNPRPPRPSPPCRAARAVTVEPVPGERGSRFALASMPGRSGEEHEAVLGLIAPRDGGNHLLELHRSIATSPGTDPRRRGREASGTDEAAESAGSSVLGVLRTIKSFMTASTGPLRSGAGRWWQHFPGPRALRETALAAHAKPSSANNAPARRSR